MNATIISLIAKQLGISEKQVKNTADLLGSGNTIPFISRYRKELTGNLNEVQVGDIKELVTYFDTLEKRKQTILKTIAEQEKLTPELENKINVCWDSIELEDIYLPYKPKRKTKGQTARDNGLEPLAKMLMSQGAEEPLKLAKRFLSENIGNEQLAIAGAQDIIAEWVNENATARNRVRQIFAQEAIIKATVVKGKEQEAANYENYFQVNEPLKRCTSHRLLAIRRAETEGFLKVHIVPKDEEKCVDRLTQIFVKKNTQSAQVVADACKDAYKRLLKPSIETELAHASKELADKQAIQVFANNLKQLLLAAPLGEKRVLAIDPGYRTGCKLVCLDEQGNLLHNETIYPHPPQRETTQASRKVQQLVETYNIQAIAIGNGTAGRETEQFIQKLHHNKALEVYVVSENGASIYSASKIAREEFPQYDVTVRGAISIGRRLIDPLAELVKIEPKSIGVGQYQHDVDQAKLQMSLDETVISAVNLVGVHLNTASEHLLRYVSGLGPSLAKNIVEYRCKNGEFTSRKELLNVPRMGEKSYEQAAGFLRIAGAKNPLDNSAVHPESYYVVEAMARALQCNIADLIGQKELEKRIRLEDFVNEQMGLFTLKDIVKEVEKPGRDPRESIKVLEFDDKLKTIEDVHVGIVVNGIVTNVTNFGAFVDIGIKENGLVHISQMAEGFVSDPSSIVSLHQHVQVKVVSVDKDKKRIQLTMKINE
ncbi:MAG: RNA-binding transcriptional accessory protein [Paludibacteraceae bacterium]|nr:RNA-binding transcriptional accessory protein [Paludibacteraceae bacterium]MBP6285086.1 RNA-binding transcriptional accessory protein [Paludibacteraceae bacterium]